MKLRRGCNTPDSAEERTVALLLQRLDGLVRQGGAGLLESLEARIEVDKVELQVQGGGQRLENPSAGLCLVNWISFWRIGSIGVSGELRTGITSRPIPSPGIRPVRDDQCPFKHRVNHTGKSYQCEESEQQQPWRCVQNAS